MCYSQFFHIVFVKNFILDEQFRDPYFQISQV